MPSLSKSLVLIIIFVTFILPLDAQVKLDKIISLKIEPTLNLSGGGESNVNLSPRDAYGKTNLIVPDFFTQYDFKLKLRKYFPENRKLKIEYQGYLLNYSSISALNESSHSFELHYAKEYQRQYRLEGIAEISKSQEKATNILGEELYRVFSFLQYRLGPKINWELNPHTELSLDYKLKIRNYEEVPGLIPFDYQEILLKNRFKGDLFIVGYDYTNRAYTKYPASNERGGELSSYPPRNWDYHTVLLEIYWIAKAKKKDNWDSVEVKFGYEDETRIDKFKDYYSYVQNKMYGKFELKLLKTKFDLDFSLKLRSYKIAEAVIDYLGKTELQSSFIDFKLQMEHQIAKYVKLQVVYIIDYRDTNKEVGLSWREYSNSIFRTGITTEF